MFLKIFIYWVSLLPLVIWGSLYEGPKIIYFLLGIVGIILFWFYRILKNKQNFKFNRSDYFFLIFIFSLLISSIFGVHPFESIIGGSYRHQGVIFFVGLWLVGKTIQVLSDNQKKLLSKTFGIIVMIEAFILATQYITGNLYFGKPLGTIGESNAVFGFLAIGSYFVLDSFPYIYLLPIYLLIIFSGSRSALLALVMVSGVFLTQLKSNLKKPVALAIILLAFTGILYISNGKGTSFIEDRPAIWKIAVSKIYQKPTLGYGAESGEFVFNKAFLSRDISLENIIIDRTHNLFLDILMWSGGLGLITFVGWLYFSFVGLDSTAKKFAFLAFLIYSIFQPLSIVHWILLITIVTI